MKKRLLAVCLTLCMLFAFGTAAWASGIMPLWDTTSDCYVTLSISGSTAECRLDVQAINGSDKITAVVTLQKKGVRGNYTNVTQWKNLSGTGSLHFYDTHTVNSSDTYRLKAEVTVKGSGKTDNITVYDY